MESSTNTVEIAEIAEMWLQLVLHPYLGQQQISPRQALAES